MRRFLAREEGGALIAAIVLAMIMMGAVTSTYAFVDNQQRESGIERTRESSFNLAEGGLTAQIVRLAQSWRGRGTVTAASGDFVDCTQASTQSYCPSAGDLLKTFASVDVGSPHVTYVVQVRDDVGETPDFFSAATVEQAHYDKDGNGKVWVRAEATVRGRTRSLVARVQVQEQQEDFPRHALVAGRLTLKNKGNKALIEPRFGSQRGPVSVRCSPGDGGSSPCLGHDPYDPGLIATQVPGVPHPVLAGPERVADAATLERLKARARADGTYYAGCPSTLTGAVVVVESCSASFNNNAVFNSPDRPGLLIWMSGHLQLSGTVVYHGVIYHENNPESAGTVVTVQGNAKIKGGLIVEGAGTAEIGSSGGCGGSKDCTQADANLDYDPNAFTNIRSYGSAGIVQNTFRELTVPR